MLKFLTWKILKAVNHTKKKTKNSASSVLNNNPSGADQTRDVVGLDEYWNKPDTRSKQEPIRYAPDLSRYSGRTYLVFTPHHKQPGI